MELILAIAMSFAPHPERLGDESYEVREREQERCNNLLMALLLPKRSTDPEIDRRLAELRGRHLRKLNALYVEKRFLRERGFEKWAETFLFTGLSKWGRTEEFFDEEVFNQYDRGKYLIGERPLLRRQDGVSGVWYWWLPGRNNKDFPEYLRWLNYYTIPAPMPHER